MKKIFSILLTFFISEVVYADFELKVDAGLGLGTLTGVVDNKTLTVTGVPVNVKIRYLYNLFNTRPVTIGTSFIHNPVYYSVGKDAYEGIRSSYGVSTSFGLMVFQNSILTLGVQKSLVSKFVALSESESKINNQTYRHSTLVTLEGVDGLRVDLSYLWLKSGPRSNKGERLFYATSLFIDTDNYTTKEVNVVSSNSELEPTSGAKEEVPSTFSSYGVSFSFSIAL